MAAAIAVIASRLAEVPSAGSMFAAIAEIPSTRICSAVSRLWLALLTWSGTLVPLALARIFLAVVRAEATSL
jgi:hypothetical protein